MDRRVSRNHRIILETALRLFMNRESGAVTMERIADEADLSRATVYNHFRCLEGVVGELLEPVLDAGIEACSRLIAEGPTPSIDETLMVMFRLWKAHRESLSAACLGIVPMNGDLAKKHGEFIDGFIALLAGARESADYRFGDVKTVSRLVFKTFPYILQAAEETENPERAFLSCMRGMLMTDGPFHADHDRKK